MSRHKLVKALDLDEELDDFDGSADPDYDEELGADDKGTYVMPLVSHLAGVDLRSCQNSYGMGQSKYATYWAMRFPSQIRRLRIHCGITITILRKL